MLSQVVKSTRVVSRLAAQKQWSRAMGSELNSRFFASASTSSSDGDNKKPVNPMKSAVDNVLRQREEAEAKRAAETALAKAKKIKDALAKAEEPKDKALLNQGQQQLQQMTPESQDTEPQEEEHQEEQEREEIPTFRSFSYNEIGEEESEDAMLDNGMPEETFEKPAYFDEDFPADFTDSMKHEVEKLEIFKDFTFLMDRSWRQQIHPLFDGEKIKLQVNCPLEEFDDRFFVDDEKTVHTKVVMEMPMNAFKLSERAQWYVEQLAGPRVHNKTLYQQVHPKKRTVKYLKITEDKFPSRVHNHKRLCDILHDLTETANQLYLNEQEEASQLAKTEKSA